MTFEDDDRSIFGSERADGFATGLTVVSLLLVVAILLGWALGRVA